MIGRRLGYFTTFWGRGFPDFFRGKFIIPATGEFFVNNNMRFLRIFA
jgi:hypothetical protein